jgi:polar amino acid transport system substrate-binding protein
MNRREFVLAAAMVGVVIPWRSAEAAANLRVGYFDKYSPFSQGKDDGSMTGLLIESLEVIARAANIKLEHHGYPWARAQAMVERGELDAFCTVPTRGRAEYALFCPTPVVTMDYGFYHRKDDLRPGKVKSLEDLRGLVQGTYRGSGYTKEYLEEERMIFLNDEETVLRRIALGTIDTLVEGEYVGAARVKSLGLEDRLSFTAAPWLPKAHFCFGVRRSHSDVESIIKWMDAATIATLRSGELAAIGAKYR